MLNKLMIIATMGAATLPVIAAEKTAPFADYHVDRFADIEVLRYDVPGFDSLTLDQKKLVYYLTEAALWGRDIFWDQNCAVNLELRPVLEAIYTANAGNPDAKDDQNWQAFQKYVKQVWFGNGIHHHYSTDKFTPGFTAEYFANQYRSHVPGANDQQLGTLIEAIFNPYAYAKRVNQADGADLVLTSACNLYAPGITQDEVEAFYAAKRDTTDATPVSYGLNSRIARDDMGNLYEQTYKIGGLYSLAIEKIVENLKLALPYAENDAQRNVIQKLIDYYTTGNLRTFDEYSIAWLGERDAQVDFVNGFIEDYGDPLAMTGAWESIVNFKNRKASHRTEVISDNAQWFEDHSPIDPRFRKPEVKGVSAKVITAAMLAGDSYPATPIGINLPNADWIRAAHGSKSVTIENITAAYDAASHGDGFSAEFVIDQPTADIMDKYLFVTDNLHTDLHECLGHGSGRLLPGVDPSAMRAYSATLEEARADLFALYYLADAKLLELGLLDNPKAYQAEYYKYMLNGLMTQLMRIEPGKDIEESHMRNRALIARWALEKGQGALPGGGNVAELIKRDGKTYLRVNDYEALRGLFGQLLSEIQRIKSEGDYDAGRALVEAYAVKVDPQLHNEVLARYATLSIAPYKGFVNPVYTPVRDQNGDITDVTVSYTEDYPAQMLRYGRDYSPLTAK